MRKARSHFSLSLLAAGLGIVLLTAVALAQSSPDAQARIEARVEVVNVGVTVTDAQGHFATNLTRENFRVSDNGVEQPITNFASIEDPAQVLIMVEIGPGVYFLEREHLLAAYSLLRGLAPGDRIALAGYDQAAHPLVNFTTDKRLVGDAIAGLHYNLGMAQLNLLDSLETSLGWLAALPGKKAIVLLSTGLDTSAPGHWEKLETELSTGEVVILPVALGGELRTPIPASGKKKKTRTPTPDPSTIAAFGEADQNLKEIAAFTGGQAFFPQKASDFAAVFSQVAALLRHQYSLGFRPQHDGQVHKIEVRVVEASGQPMLAPKEQPIYHANHRQAYLAPFSP
jgi:VWFA-related protein